MINVIIPTYNRNKCIEELLDNSLAYYNGDMFCFEIHDSSNNTLTEEAVYKFKNNYINFPLKYTRYPSDMMVDEKVTNAIRNNSKDYFYLCGDGVLCDYNKLENILIQDKYFDYIIINMENIERIGYLGQDKEAIKNKTYTYIDNVLYIGKYYSHLTFWGASIVSQKIFNYSMEKGILNKYLSKANPWWLASVLAETIDVMREEGKNYKLSTIYLDCITGNKYKEGHMWSKGEKYYNYTFSLFNQAVALLPNNYDSVKHRIIKFFRDDSLATKRFLLKLRMDGTLTYHLNKKYEKDIRFIDGIYWYMIFLTIIPKTVLKTCYNTLKSIKKLLK